uniref:Uncharacterized protein n=1 Tax=Ascaris lumbricoides TaxID=6252 RepID=A0A0M3I777_ASCLU
MRPSRGYSKRTSLAGIARFHKRELIRSEGGY